MKTSLRDIFQGLEAEDVLRGLLGVGEVQDTGYELIHSCKLSFGMHKNGDANPSASLNKDTLLFNCFTCGGGSVIWLVENALGISRDEAVYELKQLSKGLSVVPIEKFLEKLDKMFQAPENRRMDIPVYNEKILSLYSGPSEYLSNRGISELVQKKMKTGIDRNRLEADKSGNIITVDRVVIPHFIDGKLVGWVSRKTEEIDGIAKYKNTKGFPRSYGLYNMDNVREFDEVFVVESPMSVLTLLSRGIENVVATFGAKIAKPQLQLLRNYSKVIIFMDGDAPGRKAASSLAAGLREFTNLDVIDTPDGEDPASLSNVPNIIPLFQWELSRH